MDRTKNYADILTQILREKSKVKYPLQPGLKLVSSCDQETGQFLLIRIGWDKDEWFHNILFHAQVIGGRIIIEIDMTQDGLKPLLLEAGIPEEAFLSDEDNYEIEAVQVAA